MNAFSFGSPASHILGGNPHGSEIALNKAMEHAIPRRKPWPFRLVSEFEQFSLSKKGPVDNHRAFPISDVERWT